MDLTTIPHHKLLSMLESAHRRIWRYQGMGNQALEQIAIDERNEVAAELTRRKESR